MQYYYFPAYAVQVAVFCGSTNIFVATQGCGCLAEVLRVDCGQRGFFAAYLRFPVERQRTAD